MSHIHEKIDFTVDVFIVYKDKVLLRMHEKYNTWLVPGGHIELDEDPVEAAIREVKEEVGLDITIVGDAHGPNSGDPANRGYVYLIPPRYLGRHAISPTHEHISFIYFATTETDQVFDAVLEHEKGVGIKWATIDDINTMGLIPNMKFYATEALKALGK